MKLLTLQISQTSLSFLTRTEYSKPSAKTTSKQFVSPCEYWEIVPVQLDFVKFSVFSVFHSSSSLLHFYFFYFVGVGGYTYCIFLFFISSQGGGTMPPRKSTLSCFFLICSYYFNGIQQQHNVLGRCQSPFKAHSLSVMEDYLGILAGALPVSNTNSDDVPMLVLHQFPITPVARLGCVTRKADCNSAPIHVTRSTNRQTTSLPRCYCRG